MSTDSSLVQATDAQPVALGLPLAPLAWSGAAALLGGVLYSASPAGVWFVVAIAWLASWSVRDLPTRERRWVLTALLLAAALRGLAVATLPFATDYSQHSFATLFPDALYSIQRSLWIRNTFVGVPVAPRDTFEAFNTYYGWSGYNYILAYVHLLFGPSPYGAHLFSSAAFLAGAAILYRQVRQSYGPLTAGSGLIVLLFFPSLFVWSISPLWESLYFFLVAVLLVTVTTMVRARSWRGRAITAVGALVVMLAINSLRSAALVISGGGVLLGLAARAAALRRRVLALSLIVVLTGGLFALSRPSVQKVLADGLWVSASKHVGHVNTAGHSYWLLDDEFYSAGLKRELFGQAAKVRFLARAVVRFITVPEPWILSSRLELGLLPQQMVWYLLVGLAVAGAVVGLRSDALLTSLLIGYATVGIVLIAPNSGNVGTLIRHRDTVTPIVVWLGALGAVAVVGRFETRAHAQRIGLAEVTTGAAPGRRFLRRINFIDAVVALVALGLVPLGYATYLLFRTPTPQIAMVEPGSWTAGERRQVELSGRYLRPFLKVFVGKTGERIAILDRADNPIEGGYLFRSTDSAVVEMPVLVPAVYDLVLFENAQEVARKTAAFTIEAPSLAAVPSVDARVRFVIHPDTVPLVRVGDRDQVPDEPHDEAVLVAIDASSANGQLFGTMERLAVLNTVLRIPVKVTPEGWTYRGRSVRSGSGFVFETSRYVMRGWMLEVTSPDQKASAGPGDREKRKDESR